MCLIVEDKITKKKCWKDTSVMCMIGTGIKKMTCSFVTWLLKHLHCAFCSLTDSLVLACNYLFISTKSIQMLNTMFWAWIFCRNNLHLLYLYFKQKEERALTTAGKLHVLKAFTPLSPLSPEIYPTVNLKPLVVTCNMII